MNPPVDEIGVFLWGRLGPCLDEGVEFGGRHGAEVRLLPPLLGHNQEDVVSHFGHPLSPLHSAPTEIGKLGGEQFTKNDPRGICRMPRA